MPAGGIAQVHCRILCRVFARFPLEISRKKANPISWFEPKSIPNGTQIVPNSTQNCFKMRPGTPRGRCRKKGNKQVRNSRGPGDTNRVPKLLFFFVFGNFWAMKKSYENAIVANERFSTRFGHRTHFGMLRASVLRSFWAPKWYFFERKNAPRKNNDFQRFFDDVFQQN